MIKKIIIKLNNLLKKHSFARSLISTLLVIGIIYFSFMGVMILTFQTRVPMRGVTSNSMNPTFQRGDLLLIRGVSSPTDISENDILVFEYPNLEDPVAHRVIEIRNIGGELRFITHGDNNPPNATEMVHPENVLGKVVYSIPYLGYPSIIFD